MALSALPGLASSPEAFPEGAKASQEASSPFLALSQGHHSTAPGPLRCQRSLWDEQAVWGCHGEPGPFGSLSCAVVIEGPRPPARAAASILVPSHAATPLPLDLDGHIPIPEGCQQVKHINVNDASFILQGFS